MIKNTYNEIIQEASSTLGWTDTDYKRKIILIKKKINSEDKPFKSPLEFLIAIIDFLNIKRIKLSRIVLAAFCKLTATPEFSDYIEDNYNTDKRIQNKIRLLKTSILGFIKEKDYRVDFNNFDLLLLRVLFSVTSSKYFICTTEEIIELVKYMFLYYSHANLDEVSSATKALLIQFITIKIEYYNSFKSVHGMFLQKLQNCNKADLNMNKNLNSDKDEKIYSSISKLIYSTVYEAFPAAFFPPILTQNETETQTGQLLRKIGEINAIIELLENELISIIIPIIESNKTYLYSNGPEKIDYESEYILSTFILKDILNNHTPFLEFLLRIDTVKTKLFKFILLGLGSINNEINTTSLSLLSTLFKNYFYILNDEFYYFTFNVLKDGISKHNFLENSKSQNYVQIHKINNYVSFIHSLFADREFTESSILYVWCYLALTNFKPRSFKRDQTKEFLGTFKVVKEGEVLEVEGTYDSEVYYKHNQAMNIWPINILKRVLKLASFLCFLKYKKEGNTFNEFNEYKSLSNSLFDGNNYVGSISMKCIDVITSFFKSFSKLSFQINSDSTNVEEIEAIRTLNQFDVKRGYNNLVELEHKLEVITKGKALFNSSFKKGLLYLGKQNIIKFNSFEEESSTASYFILSNTNLSQTQIGELFGSDNIFSKYCLNEYLKSFDFSEVNLLEAMRTFFKGIVLPIESQKIDRIISSFGVYFYKSTKEKFLDEDIPYYLAFAILMLNTDIHNSQVRTKMSCEQFIMNVNLEAKGITKEYLEIIYNSIIKHKFVFECSSKHSLRLNYLNATKNTKENKNIKNIKNNKYTKESKNEKSKRKSKSKSKNKLNIKDKEKSLSIEEVTITEENIHSEDELINYNKTNLTQDSCEDELSGNDAVYLVERFAVKDTNFSVLQQKINFLHNNLNNEEFKEYFNKLHLKLLRNLWKELFPIFATIVKNRIPSLLDKVIDCLTIVIDVYNQRGLKIETESFVGILCNAAKPGNEEPTNCELGLFKAVLSLVQTKHKELIAGWKQIHELISEVSKYDTRLYEFNEESDTEEIYKINFTVEEYKQFYDVTKHMGEDKLLDWFKAIFYLVRKEMFENRTFSLEKAVYVLNRNEDKSHILFETVNKFLIDNVNSLSKDMVRKFKQVLKGYK
eukprot:GAHX01001352.1.p1 GENE.GAHX01001352.1~~GAHX01001352.1.p1  ORF type:complete len:1152 (+),score=288.48 GAHX01001352.1:35-3457(+)